MTFVQIITGKFVLPGLVKLRNEGKAEGMAEGVAQGETQGRAAAYIEFRAWLNRREAAIARGEPFSEPAPDEVGKPGDAGRGCGWRERASEFPGAKDRLCGSSAAGAASAMRWGMIYWVQ